MCGSLMTRHQRRHVASVMQLLLEDMAVLLEQPEVRDPAGRFAPARAAIADVSRAAGALVRECQLELPEPVPVDQRIRSVAYTWAARVSDLKAERLKGYGAVHPALHRCLDPSVDRVLRALVALGQVATPSLGT